MATSQGQADAELQEFFKNKEDVGRAILQSDEALTEKEREAADAKARAEEAERKNEIQRRRQEDLEQKLEDQRRSHEANIQYLKEKMEGDREKMLKEQNKMLESKLREQRTMLEAGFKKHSDQLNEEIGQLRRQSENVRKPSWLSDILDAASLVLPGCFGKAVGIVSNLFRRL
ncbi:guanylate-binding protein 6-like [Sphaerodactylus townsendi]|nr:guanylate-binding protein 6-like [Sphaerodactylus townsendi]